MINNCVSGVYSGLFSDKRISNRVQHVFDSISNSGSAIINIAASTHADKTAAYRLFMNERATYKNILSGSFKRCVENIEGDHVLCIQDTTEFNFSGIATKLGDKDPNIGPTTNKETAGFFCHPMLVCDPSGKNIFGLAAATLYNRSWGQKSKHERKYQCQPIEEKESYRWIETGRATRKLIPDDVAITIIADRESDIYDEFIELDTPSTHILVRSSMDRKLIGNHAKLSEALDAQSSAGEFEIKLSGNNSRRKRHAKMQVRFCQVEVRAPATYKGSRKSIVLHAVEAKEVTVNLPADQEPVLWRILTTHKVESFSMARQCIDWYKTRWLIEELFRVIKTKGFCVESSQLGSGAGLKKLIALTLEAAMDVMRLKLALETEEETRAGLIFSPKQLLLLHILLKQVEGKTRKQKNPYTADTAAWAVWIIARLGKWTGYKSNGPPGYITIKNGYNTFNIQFEIFKLMHEK